TNTFTAGLGPETYTTRVIFDLLVTGEPNTSAPANSAVNRTFTIQNNGTIQDTYSYLVTDTQGWLSGSTSGSTGVLQPGASTTVTVTVTSPNCNAASDVATLTATPVGEA